MQERPIRVIVLTKKTKHKKKKDMDDILYDSTNIGSNIDKSNPTSSKLVGTSLNDNPKVINVNGVEEEYRYGYYFSS